jgi:hypothetical protein
MGLPVPALTTIQTASHPCSTRGDKNLRAPRDVISGWEYASDTSIQLYGSWCDGFMNGTYKSVKVLFGCPGQTIP